MSNLHSQRLADFRHWLHTQQLDAFIVPHEDEYLGEYVPEHNERLHWLTGFTGSAGAAIVTLSDAAILLMAAIPFKSANKCLVSYSNIAT